jgi:Zn/Cd-binding protein ZinT
VSVNPTEQERSEAIKRVKAIRDLSDFCDNWPAIRPLLVGADFDQTMHDAPIHAAISWLVILADHVYGNDEV